MPGIDDVFAISKPRTILAYGIGSQTLVGCIGKYYPLKRGNCFGVTLQGGEKELHVLNFIVENLEKLLEDGVVAFPIKIVRAGDRHCYIHDERIPEDWYDARECSVCTPLHLTSINTQLRRFREFDRGTRVKMKDGGEMVSHQITTTRRSLNIRWSSEAKDDLKGTL